MKPELICQLAPNEAELNRRRKPTPAELETIRSHMADANFLVHHTPWQLLKEIFAHCILRRKDAFYGTVIDRHPAHADPMGPVLVLLANFDASAEKVIEFSPADILAGRDENLKPLAACDYRQVLNYLRLISGLFPDVLHTKSRRKMEQAWSACLGSPVNNTDEAGIIQSEGRDQDGTLKQVRVRVHFSAGGERIRIEKM